jgi:hypothetical protein
VHLPGFAQVKPNQPKSTQKKKEKNNKNIFKKYVRKIFQKNPPKNPKNVFKKWDPLLDALIPEQFKYFQSDQ